jgi:hypothetical protein
VGLAPEAEVGVAEVTAEEAAEETLLAAGVVREVALPLEADVVDTAEVSVAPAEVEVEVTSGVLAPA